NASLVACTRGTRDRAEGVNHTSNSYARAAHLPREGHGFHPISDLKASKAFSSPTLRSATPSVPAARSDSKRRLTSAYRASKFISFLLRTNAEKAGAAARILTDRLSSLAFPCRSSASVFVM